MADYKEQSISGNKWQRCRAVTILNPHGGQPTAHFQEEEVATYGGDTLQQDVGSCQATFSPGDVIPLLDVATLLPTGQTATHAQLYQILFSLYMATAQARDDAQ